MPPPPRLLAATALLLLSACQPATHRAAAVMPTTATPTTPAPTTPAPTMPAPTPTTVAPAPTTRAPRPAPSPVPTPRAAAFTVQRVSAADLPRSWHPGCPLAPSQLRLLDVPYVGFDGAHHRGRIVVNARVATDVGRLFTTLAADGYPIRSLRPVDDFGGSDDASMAADNTSGFNCRKAVGGSGWSVHAYGLAIDVDPRENPYLEGGTVRPPQGRPYVDRRQARTGMVHAGDRVWRAFAAIGWQWGGRWGASPDYQHFSANGG